MVGSDVTWTVAVEGGDAPYKYSWLYKGATGDFVVIDPSVNPSAATASLVNHAVTDESAGKYKCEITDAKNAKVTSVESTLTVTPA